MTSLDKLILLDRDGTLNAMVVDAEHGTINSPMHAGEVRMLPGVPVALAELNRMGYGLVIITNQPASAKGLTTRKNLEEAHALVVRNCESAGATILSSHICFHRAEDRCECRKPRTGLLREAFARHSSARVDQSWMVGDGLTDVEAGAAFGVKTCYLGPRKSDAMNIMAEHNLRPDRWCKNLEQFVKEMHENIQ